MQKLEKLLLIMMLQILFVGCDSDLSNVALGLTGNHSGSLVRLEISLLVKKRTKLEVSSKPINNAYLICYTHQLKGGKELNQEQINRNTQKLILEPNEPFAFEIKVEVERLSDGKIRVDFGDFGYLIAPSNGKVGLAVKFHKSNATLFDESGGVTSNFIEIIFEGGKVKDVRQISEISAVSPGGS